MILSNFLYKNGSKKLVKTLMSISGITNMDMSIILIFVIISFIIVVCRW